MNTDNIPLYLLTVAPASRHGEVRDLFASLPNIPIYRRVIVTTQPDPIPANWDSGAWVQTYEGTDINISKWWPLGLDFIRDHAHWNDHQQWDVLIAESDARMTPEDVETVRRVMRKTDTVMAGADWYNVTGGEGHVRIRRTNEAWIPETGNAPSAADGRVPGVMCVIAGETGIRHDPQFRWWLADDDFEWQHRANGGTVLVGGTTLGHVGTQGALTGERLTAWEEDQPKFMAKWGGLPRNGGIISAPSTISDGV